jgi:hypothetical protein
MSGRNLGGSQPLGRKRSGQPSRIKQNHFVCGRNQGGNMQFTLDPKPTKDTQVDQHHNQRSSDLDRRYLLKLGVASVVAASLPGLQLKAQSPAETCAPPIPANHGLSNGGSCPYPIPWLDKNGNHNQSPAPNVELSNIFHFKGKLARCNGFHGMGTDNKGNRFAWGNPTTDYSYMAGEYWAGRQARQGIFTHT